MRLHGNLQSHTLRDQHIIINILNPYEWNISICIREPQRARSRPFGDSCANRGQRHLWNTFSVFYLPKEGMEACLKKARVKRGCFGCQQFSVMAFIQNRRDAPLLLKWGEGDLNSEQR